MVKLGKSDLKLQNWFTIGGTLPPEDAISPLKPDIVIVDKPHKKVSILELICPAEHRIVTAHMLKNH